MVRLLLVDANSVVARRPVPATVQVQTKRPRRVKLGCAPPGARVNHPRHGLLLAAGRPPEAPWLPKASSPPAPKDYPISDIQGLMRSIYPRLAPKRQSNPEGVESDMRGGAISYNGQTPYENQYPASFTYS